MPQKNKPVVAIIGGSFAGLSVILKLRQRLGNNIEIKLFDMHKKFCYIPALHEAILAPKKRLEKAMFSLKKYYGKEYIQGKVTKVHDKSLETEDGRKYDFDYCVVATGSYVSFFNNPDWAQHGIPVRYAADIPKLNKALRDKSNKQITIVGGGLTGIEVATVIAERKRDDQKVRIVHSRERVFHYLSEKVSNMAQKRLDKHNIECVFNTKVTSIKKNSIVLDNGDTMESDVTVVSAGITLNNEMIPKSLTFDKNYKAKEANHIFTAGDVAAQGLYTTAHNAMMEGRRVGDLIADRINDIEVEYHELMNWQILAIAFGGKDGIIINGKNGVYIPRFTGFAKRVIEQRVLIEFTRKIMFWI